MIREYHLTSERGNEVVLCVSEYDALRSAEQLQIKLDANIVYVRCDTPNTSPIFGVTATHKSYYATGSKRWCVPRYLAQASSLPRM
jgi:hypothetical protein